jgi:hypothetical protein
MPVRPLTESENKLANGEPVTVWLGLFGASQGLLTHLRFNGLSMGAKNLMPTPFAKVTLPVLVISGAVLGGAAGYQFFGDSALRRLKMSHALDRLTRTESQSYIPKDQL